MINVLNSNATKLSFFEILINQEWEGKGSREATQELQNQKGIKS